MEVRIKYEVLRTADYSPAGNLQVNRLYNDTSAFIMQSLIDEMDNHEDASHLTAQ